MLDFRTLALGIGTSSAVLVAALWAGLRGDRRDGTGAFLRAVTLQTAASVVVGLRPLLTYAVGLAGGNVLAALAFSSYAQALAELAGRPFARSYHVVPAALMGLSMLALERYEAPRVTLVNAVFAVVFAGLTRSARALPPRGERSPPRALLALGFGTLAAVSATRAVAAAGLLGPPLHADSQTPLAVATVLLSLAGFIAVAVGFLLTKKERSERALAALRGSLEAQVTAQVERLTRDEAEVERLHGELRQRVRERSEALNRVLERLALRFGEGGSGGVAVGAVLGERFELRALLGTGGMGAVYRALDRATGEPVAVKLVRATSADELEALRRFLREARASAAVPHPAVVYARHVDVWQGQLYIVFELVRGAPLNDVLAGPRALEPAVVAALGAGIADALAAAHERGVVHRDLKPGNVMLSAEPPAVRLLDFGIARLREAVLDEVTRTQGGALMGTPAYMAPEQALDARTAGGEADVYALGVLLFEALAGRLPFTGREVGKQIVARITGAAPRVAEVAPATPAALAALVDECLRREPAERPTAREVAARCEALAATLGGRPEQLAALLDELAPGA